MRLLFADYTKVAAELDDEYNKFSPYRNDKYCRTGEIEFSLTLDDVPAPQELKASKSIFARFSLDIFKGPLFEVSTRTAILSYLVLDE